MHRHGFFPGLVASLGILIAGSGVANAAETSYDSDVSARYRPRAERFIGTVSSDLPQAEAERTGADCVNGRNVSLYRRRADGSLRLVGRTTTTEARWRIDHAARRSPYVVRLAATEHSYAPEYGDMEVTTCEAASISIRVTADQVLGIRIGRDTSGSGLLPVTGPSAGVLAIAGLGHILGGLLLSHVARRAARRAVRAERPPS